ncbi:MAG: peptide ABC transporter substrate-binding protein [Chloroflexota bacterium]|nr:peptide ABC transporter substrate-binding protein [Chloroflexota bacterium]MDE3101765.1 peptide ABC transporter substrate-binding protein [Chloroflexota bacterium]
MTTKLSRRRFLILGSATALAAACAPSTSGAPGASASAGGGAAGTPQKGGSLTFALDSDISDLDPMMSSLFVDRNIHYQMYDSLVRINAKGEIIPGLATKWTTSSDGKSVTFELRQGVKYQDGTAFDAASVKWNLDRYRQKGSHRTGELAPVESVDVVDPKTVKVDLKSPFAPFLSILVDRAGMMVSQKVVEAMGKDFTVHPYKAGTGAFILTEAVKSDHYTLTRNPDYWEKDKAGNALPYLDSITFKPILDPNVRLTNVRTGQAQVLTRMSGKDIPTVKSDSTLTFTQTSAYGWDSMIPNRSPGALFSEGRYVKAVSMALDREQLLNDGPAKGVGAVGYGPYAPSHFCYDPSFKPYPKADPAGAKKLIDEVGKGPLTFELLVPSGSPDTLQLAQLIQSQLKNAGITMNIKTELFNQIVKISEQHQQPGMSLYGWSGRIDPDQNTYDFVVTGQPNNDSAYSNTQVDQLMKQQRTETDQSKRTTDLRKAQQIFVVDDPARIWYDFAASILLTVKAVQGLDAYPDQIARLEYGWLKK